MIQPIGHFRVWRALYTKPIWLNSTLEQQVILMTLIAMANWKANEWEWEGDKYELSPGQFITSANSIISNTGNKVTRQNVRTALARFEKLGFLTTESTKRGSLITLTNWTDYQHSEGNPNQVPNQGLTNSQPTLNQGLTTIEEGKKVKKDNKEYSVFLEEVWKLYPNKKGKGQISDTRRKEIFKIGEEFKRCISRYVEYVESERDKGFKDLKYQNGSTFFNSGYIDYLDDAYDKKELIPKKPPLTWVIRDDY